MKYFFFYDIILHQKEVMPMLKKDISLLTDDELLDIIFNSSENIGINYLKELKKRSNIKYYNLFANNQDKIASYFNKIKDSGVKG